MDHVNYPPPSIAKQGGIINKVWMKFIEITSTNRNATEHIFEKYKTNPVEHKRTYCINVF